MNIVRIGPSSFRSVVRFFRYTFFPFASVWNSYRSNRCSGLYSESENGRTANIQKIWKKITTHTHTYNNNRLKRMPLRICISLGLSSFSTFSVCDSKYSRDSSPAMIFDLLCFALARTLPLSLCLPVCVCSPHMNVHVCVVHFQR